MIQLTIFAQWMNDPCNSWTIKCFFLNAVWYHTHERDREMKNKRERIYFDPMENDQMVNEWD